MALGFLLNTVSPLVELVGHIAGQKKANAAFKQYNHPTKGEVQANALYQALLDPDSPLVNRLYEEEKSGLLDDFQSQIRTMQNADRRSAAAGRTPTFFNPERADEAISFLTSRGLPQVSALADQQARNRILDSARGFSGMVPAQTNRQDLNRDQALSRAASRQQIPTQIMDMLRGLISPPQGPTRTGQPIQSFNPNIYNQMRY